MKKTLSHAAIIIGAALIVMAILLPAFLVPKLKSIPLDTVSTTITDTREGSLLDSGALAKNEPVKGRENDPRCEGEDLPVHCFIGDQTPLRSNRHVHTEEPSDGDVVTLEVGTTIIRDDREEPANLVNATIDRITLDRYNSYPVDEPISTTQYHDPSQPGADQLQEFTRPGIQYQFPMGAEKKSYPYYDVVGLVEQPIDFIDEEEQDGATVYKYEMVIEPVNLYESFQAHQTANGRELTKADKDYMASLRLTFPANKWGLEGDDDVTMDRYYANVRTVRVEPTTGMIVNGTEHIFQFYARDPEEAKRIAGPDRAKEERERNRTAMDFVAQWSEETKANQLNQALDSKSKLSTFGTVAPIILGILGLILVVVGIIGIRRH